MSQTQQATRTRTFGWTDPTLHAELLGRRPGLELLRAMAAGELPPPPIMNLIDYGGMTADEGPVTFTLQPQEFHYTPLGCVHGGVIATVLDTATGCAVHTTLPAGVGYTSLDLAVKFLRTLTVATGPVTVTGEVLQRGRRTSLAEAR